MTSCTPFEEINAFVDGQLATAAEIAVRRHLDVCADCGATVETLLALKDAVAASVEVRPVPHTLRERLGALPRPRGWIRGVRPRRPAGLAAVALLALGVFLWVLGRGRSGADPVSQAFVADHLHFLQEPHAIELAATDPERLSTWFEGRVPFAVQVPRLQSARLLGGRLCSLWGQKVALTFYEAHGRRLSLFTLDRNTLPASVRHQDGCTVDLADYRVCLVPAPPAVFAMVADAAQAAVVLPELRRLVTRQ
jgi:anti-sigma factor RsiW